MKQKDKPAVKSVATTFRIIEALQALDGAGVTELSNHLDLPKSNVYNYLSTLLQQEYVVKDGNEYKVGIGFLELGAYARNRKPIFEIAKPEVENLAQETGELANLMIEEHGKGCLIYRSRGENSVKVEAHTGNRLHLHQNALGKSILAYLPTKRVEEIVDIHGLPKRTENTITNREELFTQLETIRDQGYAIDDEERIIGLKCIAAPILSDDKRILGSISIGGPTSRMQGNWFKKELPEKLRETVNVIELNVTFG